MFTKVQLLGTKLVELENIGSKYVGISVDIFPIEETYDSFLLRLFHGFSCFFYSAILSCVRTSKKIDYFKKYISNDKELYQAYKIKNVIGKLLSYKKIEEWLSKADKCYKKCTKKGKYVVIPTGRNGFFGEIYKRTLFVKKIVIEFEKRDYYITKDFDNYLSKLYGDYLSIPNKCDIEKHKFIEIEL